MNNNTMPKPTYEPNDELRMSIRECSEAAKRIYDALDKPDEQSIATARVAAQSMVGAFEEIDRALVPVAATGREYAKRELDEIAAFYDKEIPADATNDHEIIVEAGVLRQLVARLRKLSEGIVAGSSQG